MYVVPVREKEVTTRLVTAGRRVKLYGIQVYPPPPPRVQGGAGALAVWAAAGPPLGTLVH